MSKGQESEARASQLHAGGVVDMHFDLLMDLYEKRAQPGVLAREFLPDFEAGNVSVLAAAIYLEDRYIPDQALQVATDQIARLYSEAGRCDRLAICKSFSDIQSARAKKKIAILISMEGIEPLGGDLDLLRVFYELGVRVIGLTHARTNAAASGAVFAASGSASKGLTDFGRNVVRECERLGMVVDLAHLNPAGVNEVLALATKPPVISHTNVRSFYDIERNSSDDQIRRVGERGGVVGVNSVLVSRDKSQSTLDRYIDHIERVIDLAGGDAVGIGFDFFEFIWRQWPEKRRQQLADKLAEPHFIPGLTNHSHALNLTRGLVRRGFSDGQIEKILRRNWMRILEQLL